MTQPKEIFVRLDRCMGCHSCKVACAVEHSSHQTLYCSMYESPMPKPRIYVEWVKPERSVPVVCRHCEDAPCMHACIAGAISRGEAGVVFTDADKCIGCWTCVMVCPYGVIGRHIEQRNAYRCDRCPNLDQPACVSACPTRALVFQSAEDYSGQKRQEASRELISAQEADREPNR